jgi:serine/threonine-protein kinase HipA
LSREHGGELVFDYDPAYAETPTSCPLSACLPLAQRHHTGPQVTAWFDNLLPDNDRVRSGWAQRLGSPTATAFDLLARVGEDCPGAIQVLPPGVQPDQTEELEPITDAQIATRLRALRNDDADWTGPGPAGRWSLGGYQGKFALARRPDGGWWAPLRRAPSTHIVKPGLTGVQNADAAEFVTLRAAAALGLPTAKAELVMFGDQRAIVVERFDRETGPDGVRRLHQEDLCQALGLDRHLKYEDDGGPGLARCAATIATTVTQAERARARDTFAAAAIFNIVTAGLDAHAKNFSLTWLGRRAYLAPLYDLTSAALLWPPAQITYSGRLAMAIGGVREVYALRPNHIEAAAADLGVSADQLFAELRRQLATLPDAFADAIAAARPATGPAVARTFSTRINARLKAAQALYR